MFNLLLVCGTGASSGFMAKNIRKAAKEENWKSTSRLEVILKSRNILTRLTILLVGPHLRYMLNDLNQIAAPYHVPVRIIDDRAYGALDGKAVLHFALDCLKEEKKGVNS